MAAITAAQFTTLIDYICKGYNDEMGAHSAGYGTGDPTQTTLSNDWGGSRLARELLAYTLGLGDYSLQVQLSSAANTRATQIGGSAIVVVRRDKTFLATVARVCVAAGISGVTGLESFALYYNSGAGGPYNALLPPIYRTLLDQAYGVFPNPINVYAPIAANVGQQVAGGAFTAGTTADTTMYAGFARIMAVVPSYTGAGGTITVTANVRKADGTTATGRPFTGTIPTNGGVTVALVPTNAGDIATAITAISLPGGVTGGVTVVIAATIPAGRTDTTVPTGGYADSIIA